MLKKDKERLKYKDGTDEMSALDKRINSLLNFNFVENIRIDFLIFTNFKITIKKNKI